LVGLRLRLWRNEHARLVAGLAIAMISAASLAFAFAQTADNPRAAYFSTFDRAWELGLGALIAIAAPRLTRGEPRLRTAIAWSGLLAVLVSLVIVPTTSGVPAPWLLLPTLGTAAVLAAGADESSR